MDQSKSDQSTSQPPSPSTVFTALPKGNGQPIGEEDADHHAPHPTVEDQAGATAAKLITPTPQPQTIIQTLKPQRDPHRPPDEPPMAQQSQYYQTLFADCPHGLVVTDLAGIIQTINASARQVLEAETSQSAVPSPSTPHPDYASQAPKALIGRSLLTCVSPESHPALSTVLDTLAGMEQHPPPLPHPLDVLLVSASGTQRWVQLSVRLLPGEPHSPSALLWSMANTTQTEIDLKRQISEIHQQYAHIKQKNQALEAAIQAKNSQVLKATEFESTLKRITDKVRDSLDESKILQTVVRELSTVLQLGGCNTALYDLEKGTSTIFYEYTNFISAYRGKVAQMDHFPELYNQLRQGHYFQFCSLVPNPERGHVALLACPIFMDADADDDPDTEEDNASHGETVLGDLWLINRKEHVFNEFEIRLVQQVANQCAIAIRQARLYKAAQSQVHELEKLNRMKDEFLSTVSHELRTPLANVKMAIHMLKNARTDEKREQYIRILETESERETSLINDLLDLQRLEVSRPSITLQTQAIVAWLHSIAQSFASRIAAHSQRLELEATEPALTITTDLSILERIVVELLNNACKYTPSDHGIRVTVHQTEDRDIQFGVSNQASIAQEELPRIFDKFYRVPNADPWKQGGTGLGLALVRQLVKQLDGTINVHSVDGWTHFSVLIPNKVSTQDHAPEPT